MGIYSRPKEELYEDERRSQVYDPITLINYLKKIDFIGPFPHGMEVLLTPIEPALQEARGLYPNLTKNKFLSLLRKEGVFVFKSAEEYGEVLKQARISK